jgi:hypothetical protein
MQVILTSSVCTVLDMLRTLLEKPALVEDYVEWMDKIVERKLMKVGNDIAKKNVPLHTFENSSRLNTSPCSFK